MKQSLNHNEKPKLILKDLKEKSFFGKVLIMGIGNPQRGDDAVGSIFVKELKNKLKKISLIDAEATPENFLAKIINEAPHFIFILDSADLGRRPGEIFIVEASEFKENKNLYFTHNFSISLIVKFLKTYLNAEIYLILVQPKRISFKEGLSPEVEISLSKLKNWFLHLDNLLR